MGILFQCVSAPNAWPPPPPASSPTSLTLSLTLPLAPAHWLNVPAAPPTLNLMSTFLMNQVRYPIPQCNTIPKQLAANNRNSRGEIPEGPDKSAVQIEVCGSESCFTIFIFQHFYTEPHPLHSSHPHCKRSVAQ